MNDCIYTLHAIMRDPEEMARARDEIQQAWTNASKRLEKPARARLVATAPLLRGIAARWRVA